MNVFIIIMFFVIIMFFQYYNVFIISSRLVLTLLGHTTSTFSSIRTGRLLNANRRIALQEAEVRFETEKYGASLEPPALQSGQQVEDREWDGGDTEILHKDLHRSSTTLISHMGDEKSKCL